MLFYSIAISFDLYQGSMMDEAIDGGRGEGIVLVEDFSPIPEGSVCGYHDGAAFIAIGDDLKEEFGPLLVHGEKA
jgi:hypothetical protein